VPLIVVEEVEEQIEFEKEEIKPPQVLWRPHPEAPWRPIKVEVVEVEKPIDLGLIALGLIALAILAR